MTALSDDELAGCAEWQRDRGHLTDGRADAAEHACAGAKCQAAQAVADHFHNRAGSEK